MKKDDNSWMADFSTIHRLQSESRILSREEQVNLAILRVYKVIKWNIYFLYIFYGTILCVLIFHFFAFIIVKRFNLGALFAFNWSEIKRNESEIVIASKRNRGACIACSIWERNSKCEMRKKQSETMRQI